MVQIIAEIGLNHNGDLWLAEKMIEQAKLCGADHVKFQSYDPNKLLDKNDFSKEDWEVICKSSNLNYPDLFRLRRICIDIGIGFICSIFDIDRIDWLIKLCVTKYKIASRSIYDRELCDTILSIGKDQAKEVLISMGWLNRNKEVAGDEYNEDFEAFKRLAKGKGDVRFLKCISKYPTPLKDVDLHLDTFNTSGFIYGYTGFSDHTIGISTSQLAIAYGAQYIEKHFTFDKGAKGPDHKCSIEPSELKALCKFRDDYEEMRNG